MQLKDSKLRIKPDKSSYLLCKYTFSGTQVTKIQPLSMSAHSPHDAFRSNIFEQVNSNNNSNNNSINLVALPDSEVDGQNHQYPSELLNQQYNRREAAAKELELLEQDLQELSDTRKRAQSNISTSDLTSSESFPSGASNNNNNNNNNKTKRKKIAVKQEGVNQARVDSEATNGNGISNQEPVIVHKEPLVANEMLPNIVKINVVGTLIIHINAENRIFRFEYIQKVIRLA